MWYAIFPAGASAALLSFGGLTYGPGSQAETYLIPGAIGLSITIIPSGWWLMRMDKPISLRATYLTAFGLFSSALLAGTLYAMSLGRGLLYSILESGSLVGFMPGLIGGLYFLTMGEMESMRLRGQKVILAGILSLIYLGFGSLSVDNIASNIFHLDLLSQIWTWLSRIGFVAAPTLVGLGVLITRRSLSSFKQQESEDRKQSWGEWIRGWTFLLTMLGVFLSGVPITVLGGLIAIVAGFACYPIGLLIDRIRAANPASIT